MNELESISERHVVVLINYIRRHHVLAFKELAKRVGKLTILVSTPMEGNRGWVPEWENLNVIVQKNSTLTLKRSLGFDEHNYVHIPWDTVWQLRRLKPDIILSYEMGMRTLFCAGFRLFARRTPLVMVGNMSNALESRRGILRKAFRKVIKSTVDYCTYNGPSCKKYLTSIGIDENKLMYIPYCFDRDKTFQGKKRFCDDGVRRVLYCGALSERKAVLPFAALLSDYCNSNLDYEIEFRVAGDGPYREGITRLSGTNLSVELLGNCGPEKLRECYSWADVCVFPSLGDEWGLVPVEAWASGVPVLGSKYAQSVEAICRHNENGWIFDSKCEIDTRNAIEKMLSTSNEQLLFMSRNARAMVNAYSPVESANHLCEVVRHALLENATSASDQTKRRPVSIIDNGNDLTNQQTRPETKFDLQLDNMKNLPLATMSLDLDNKWAYLKSQNDPSWESLPSYLNLVVPRILSVLDELNLRITFFVVGQDAVIKENQDSLRMIADRGHEIANHSFHHEPCLHLYTPGQLQQEFELSESAIEKATGNKTVGFRGPGFSSSDQTLKTLVRRGYMYDCTVFPTFLGPLARAYHFMNGSFTKKQRQEKAALFGKFKDGFMPNDPYLWNSELGQLLELPVTTFPVLKTPLHATYLHYLAGFSPWMASTYFSSALTAFKFNQTPPSFLLHPLDFMGAEDEPGFAFFPGMKIDTETKLLRIKQYLTMYKENFDVLTMQKFAKMALSGELGQRSITLARTGVS